MRSYDSAVFGTVPLPETFAELLDLITEPPPTRKGRVRMWRGQADIAWPIHSSAYRRLAARGGVVTEDDLRIYENRLLRQAAHRGYSGFDSRALTHLELLARLQHHGASTRLVDASRSALVALWFCVSTHPDKTGTLIGIHSDFIGGHEGYPINREYEQLIEAIAVHDHPYTWEPSIVSPRIAAQHSQFLISRVVDAQTGSLCLPADPGATLTVAIDPSMKELARDLLINTFDVRNVTLFPDFDGFAAANAHNVDIGEMSRW